MTLIMRTISATDPGLVRSNNEDAAYAGERLVAVADGIGGQPAGEVASEIAIAALMPLDQSPDADQTDADPADADQTDADPADALSAAVAQANARIRAAAGADPSSEGMGTTLTAALLADDRLVLAHIGDSRCYLLRDGRLYQLTRDDTFVQELVDEGVLSPDEARRHPQRSMVTRAVQGRDVAPAVTAMPAAAGDRLLLCSDGLSDVVDDASIGQALTGYADRQHCAEQLVKLAHQAGAPDNITTVIADLVSED
ncbi:PP2C family serine/threonine-protein phosphatase [Plantactinospora sp. KBS50]|uniref:PP2C family protein-serine/threonine phosphatase n=1 Tax=Plantactinospora sp. KBS50 TaxID=2024580 RepID=UPI000BAAF360|nr:protein phosphatase 2C domain-containing protein [Plantactinospora sp. KBS50]ASW53156.1 protein phosphatase [Plantactinospora sp. KBS50]